ncbi:hypothetical protein CON65_00030 [Bacillus pseudomycoides]|uniref:Uncharacterized protein n=1 Tax=Bacillus pseudomycoides TaxID=64104 RepID=A0AA91VGL1_9BACI|nr:hypothetical protein [Bacillus sp. AFS014408]PEB50570.1 hypothetical protein COO03_21405 [Bacillus sp. AFS098217]PED84649.1 hypothetical protein CON65_00030 [Bacillus pseudomycoides]PEU07056.1 hypothetical protein CN524_21640 [Bacillus sp. AFS019443]PFW60535.1 hypothetical protein COL20_21600 [Bacillus sp. AFS075034]PEU18366.1 hypothetical protein CN525_12035 [Bacillus sp. AFS014408]
MPNRNSSPPYRLALARHALEDGDFFRKYVKLLKVKSHDYGWFTMAYLILSESKVWGGSQCQGKNVSG